MNNRCTIQVDHQQSPSCHYRRSRHNRHRSRMLLNYFGVLVQAQAQVQVRVQVLQEVPEEVLEVF